MGSCYVCSNCGKCREVFKGVRFDRCVACGKPVPEGSGHCPSCGTVMKAQSKPVAAS